MKSVILVRETSIQVSGIIHLTGQTNWEILTDLSMIYMVIYHLTFKTNFILEDATCHLILIDLSIHVLNEFKKVSITTIVT